MEIILALFLGILIGIITGLTPGIHSNLAASVIAAYLSISQSFNTLSIAIMIISMGVTHSITDIIPSIFLGMPDSEKIMTALPAHKMLLDGDGLEAVSLAVIGAFAGALLSIITLPLTILFFSYTYYKIHPFIGPILLVLITILIMKEKNKAKALAILSITGILGIFVFRLNVKEPLLPMLSGLFGISALALGYAKNAKLPPQKQNFKEIKKEHILKPSLISLLLGIISAFLPGMGPSQIAALGSGLAKSMTEKGYIVLSSALSTINLIAGIAAFYALGKSRSGIIVAVQTFVTKINFYDTLIISFAILAAAGIASIITILIAKKAAGLISKIPYRKISFVIILFVALLVFLISGPLGLLILLTSTSLGIYTQLQSIPRQHMMGCILLPVILFFIGINL